MPIVADIRLGQRCNAALLPAPILKRADIFGVDLYEAGLADTVAAHFTEMIKDPGTVAAVLENN